jgi:hypothetical protein
MEILLKMTIKIHNSLNKSLKIPKRAMRNGYNLRTGNTMSKRKINKQLSTKLQIE